MRGGYCLRHRPNHKTRPPSLGSLWSTKGFTGRQGLLPAQQVVWFAPGRCLEPFCHVAIEQRRLRNQRGVCCVQSTQGRTWLKRRASLLPFSRLLSARVRQLLSQALSFLRPCPEVSSKLPLHTAGPVKTPSWERAHVKKPAC